MLNEKLQNTITGDTSMSANTTAPAKTIARKSAYHGSYKTQGCAFCGRTHVAVCVAEDGTTQALCQCGRHGVYTDTVKQVVKWDELVEQEKFDRDSAFIGDR